MLKDKIKEIIMEIPEKFEGISKAYYEYYKAASYERFVVVISGLAIITFLSILFFLFLVFLTFGVAFYLGNLFGNYAWGFLIIAAFYLILGILVYVKRSSWIVNPVVRMLEMLFYSDDQGIFDKLTKNKGDEEEE